LFQTSRAPRRARDLHRFTRKGRSSNILQAGRHAIPPVEREIIHDRFGVWIRARGIATSRECCSSTASTRTPGSQKRLRQMSRAARISCRWLRPVPRIRCRVDRPSGQTPHAHRRAGLVQTARAIGRMTEASTGRLLFPGHDPFERLAVWLLCGGGLHGWFWEDPLSAPALSRGRRIAHSKKYLTHRQKRAQITRERRNRLRAEPVSREPWSAGEGLGLDVGGERRPRGNLRIRGKKERRKRGRGSWNTSSSTATSM